MSRRVLIVDDEKNMVDTLVYNLRKDGYEISVAYDGEEALEVAECDKPDLIILDLMLPVIDGFEVCRIIRRKSDIPIIMLTAKEEEVDKVVGLELGADDYITKPFSLRELRARIKAVLRRYDAQIGVEPSQNNSWTIGELVVDSTSHQVTSGGEVVDLSPKEYDLLEILIKNAGQVLSRELLIDRIWGADYFGDEQTLNVHIRKLRQKIGDDFRETSYIQTVRGVGYRFWDGEQD